MLNLIRSFLWLPSRASKTYHTHTIFHMASVYKSMAKGKANGKTRDEDAESKPKNRQRVLILTSRGVTYR